MYLSYLPDEINVPFEESLQIGAELGLTCAEMRSVDGVNVIDLSDEQIDRAKRLLDRYGMRVSALATPFLKCTLPGLSAHSSGPMHQAREMPYEEHLRLIKRGAEIAKAFGAERMRLFSFWRHEGVDFWPGLIQAVDECLAEAEGTGVALSLENEGACFIGTTAELAAVSQKIADPRLTFIYDPGNSAHAGMPPRAEDLEAMGHRIALVHIKDARHDGPRSTPALIGEGSVRYAEELKRIAAVYDGPLTLEPHYAPGGDTVEGMRQSVAALRRLAGEADLSLTLVR